MKQGVYLEVLGPHLRLESSRCHTEIYVFNASKAEEMECWRHNCGRVSGDRRGLLWTSPTPLISVGFETIFNGQLCVLADPVTQSSILKQSALRIRH